MTGLVARSMSAIPSAPTAIRSVALRTTTGTATSQARIPSSRKSKAFQPVGFACRASVMPAESRSAVRPTDGKARNSPANAARNERIAPGKRLRSAHQNSYRSVSVPLGETVVNCSSGWFSLPSTANQYECSAGAVNPPQRVSPFATRSAASLSGLSPTPATTTTATRRALTRRFSPIRRDRASVGA